MVKSLTSRIFIVRYVRLLALAGLVGLAALPAAASASAGAGGAAVTNADTGGVGVAALGCDAGAIHGFARVKGTAASFPDIYSTSATFVDVKYNCAGDAATTISVRRQSTGVYFVRFAGNASALAIASNNADGLGTESTNNDNVLTVAKVTDTDGGSSFRVEVQDVCGDCSAGTDPQNGQFVITLI